MDLNKDVKYVKTVGPNRVKLLNKLKINTLKDLITYYPRDYEDRSKPKNLYECVDGEEVLIEAMAAGKISEMRKGKMVISKLIVKAGYSLYYQALQQVALGCVTIAHYSLEMPASLHQLIN